MGTAIQIIDSWHLLWLISISDLLSDIFYIINRYRGVQCKQKSLIMEQSKCLINVLSKMYTSLEEKFSGVKAGKGTEKMLVKTSLKGGIWIDLKELKSKPCEHLGWGGQAMLGNGNSKYKGLQMQACLVYLWDSKRVVWLKCRVVPRRRAKSRGLVGLSWVKWQAT